MSDVGKAFVLGASASLSLKAEQGPHRFWVETNGCGTKKASPHCPQHGMGQRGATVKAMASMSSNPGLVPVTVLEMLCYLPEPWNPHP